MSGVIVVDVESFRSTCFGRDAYIHDHRLDILITITTREKASSSAGFRCISSAGRGATNKALQLTHSSSACSPTLLLHKCSSSAVSGSLLLLVALARFAWTRYCYRSAAANFYTLASANLSSFFWNICFVFEQAL